MKQLFQNSKGFSLVQVMVSVGIMGGMAVMMMQLSENQNKQQKGIELKAEQGDVANIIRQTLRDKEACESTFLGMSPGDEIKEIRMNPDLSKPPFAKTGEKFKNYKVFIKSMTLLTRQEEITFKERPAGSNAIDNYKTGAGFGRLRVTFVKQQGVITDANTSHNFFGVKESVITFLIKGNFYDTEIVKHNDNTKLNEACWAKAATVGVSCNASNGERCNIIELDEDPPYEGCSGGCDWIDNISDAATGTKLYLAECRYIRDNSPFMACAEY